MFMQGSRLIKSVVFTTLSRAFLSKTGFFSVPSVWHMVVKNTVTASTVWCHYLNDAKVPAVLLIIAFHDQCSANIVKTASDSITMKIFLASWIPWKSFRRLEDLLWELLLWEVEQFSMLVYMYVLHWFFFLKHLKK